MNASASLGLDISDRSVQVYSLRRDAARAVRDRFTAPAAGPDQAVSAPIGGGVKQVTFVTARSDGRELRLSGIAERLAQQGVRDEAAEAPLDSPATGTSRPAMLSVGLGSAPNEQRTQCLWLPQPDGAPSRAALRAERSRATQSCPAVT